MVRYSTPMVSLSGYVARVDACRCKACDMRGRASASSRNPFRRNVALTSHAPGPHDYRNAFNVLGEEADVNSYVVRIYRYEPSNPRRLVGTVEEVGVNEKKAFTDIDELWQILNPLITIKTAEKTGSSRSRTTAQGTPT